MRCDCNGTLIVQWQEQLHKKGYDTELGLKYVGGLFVRTAIVPSRVVSGLAEVELTTRADKGADARAKAAAAVAALAASAPTRGREDNRNARTNRGVQFPVIHNRFKTIGKFLTNVND
eukprot:2635686-Amphidinium_carterae.1